MSYQGQGAGGSGTVTSVGVTASANITVTGSPVTSAGDIDLQMVETDPVYSASSAASITGTDITNLANLSGTNTGDQDLSVLLDKATYDPDVIAEQVVGLTASQSLSNKSLDTSCSVNIYDSVFGLQDNGDPSKAMRFDVSTVGVGNQSIISIPDANGTIALLSNKLDDFASTTSAELASVISDGTGTGSLVFADTPTLIAPELGEATATSLETVGNITSGAKVIASDVVRLMGFTVGTLPTGTQGDTAFVTDALLPTFLGTVAGGGAVVTKVFYDGSAWIVQ